MSSQFIGQRSSFSVSGQRRLLGLLGLAWVVFHAGCASGEYTYVTTTAYGERLRIPLERGVPERATKGTIQVLNAMLLPGSEADAKSVFYVFAYVDTSAVTPSSVRVEDVTDEKPILIYEDLDPKLVEQRWGGRTPLMTVTHPALEWTTYVGETFRIYRFTITKANGEQVVLNQAWSVAGWTKQSIRKTLGIED